MILHFAAQSVLHVWRSLNLKWRCVNTCLRKLTTKEKNIKYSGSWWIEHTCNCTIRPNLQHPLTNSTFSTSSKAQLRHHQCLRRAHQNQHRHLKTWSRLHHLFLKTQLEWQAMKFMALLWIFIAAAWWKTMNDDEEKRKSKKCARSKRNMGAYRDMANL